MFIKNSKFESYKIKSIIFEEKDYEFYRIANKDILFITVKTLYDKWVSDGILYNVNPFEHTIIDNIDYYWMISNKEFAFSPIKFNNQLCDKNAALNFSFVLKQMRKITNISLYDGIYSEEYGFILPTYTEETASDDALVGTYLSGGQSKYFSEDNKLSLFLTDDDYSEISQLLGIPRTTNTSDIQIEKDNNTVSVKSNRTSFSLPGRKNLETFFNEHIIAILNDPERYKKLGIDFPSSIILYGPPGCGKTFAVNKLVEFIGLPVFEINSSSVASPYIHDTSKKIAATFESAISNAPAVVIIDEMESYLSNRNNANSDTHHLEEVAEFLRQIQQAQDNKVLIIAMTNMIDSIDPAILRRGRFDHKIEVGYPSEEEIISLLNSLLKKVSVADDVDTIKIAKELEGKSLADVAFAIKEAALISGKNGLDKITNDSIAAAINTMPKPDKMHRLGFYTDEE